MALEIARHNEVTVAASNIIRIERLFESIPGVILSELKFKINIANLVSARRLLVDGKFDVVHVGGVADHQLIWLATLALHTKPPLILTKTTPLKEEGVGNFIRTKFAADAIVHVHATSIGQSFRSGLGNIGNLELLYKKLAYRSTN
ncbi:hypothetical protein [Burkholderia orbicola]|uniref:hypothetical protein n=1 Tax=Burkholderia orbicola TaxID=2978683 RepID=UPI002FE1D3FA